MDQGLDYQVGKRWELEGRGVGELAIRVREWEQLEGGRMSTGSRWVSNHEMVSAPVEEAKTSNDHIESNFARPLSVASNVLHCLVAAACVNVKMSVIASIIRGISTTAAETLNSAELSFQQAIRSPTATANGNDRQTLLWHRRPVLPNDLSIQNTLNPSTYKQTNIPK